MSWQLKFQLDSSTTELNTIAGQIEAAKLQAGLLERVAQLHTLLEGLKKTEMETDVVRYSQAVAEAGKILGQAEGGIETELDIWGPVKFEVERCKDQLVKFLEDSWNGHVQWMSKSDQGEPVKVKLYADAGKLKDTFIALASIDQLDRLLCEWSTRLLEEVLGPLMKADSVIQFEQDHFEVLGGEQNVFSHFNICNCFYKIGLLKLETNLGGRATPAGRSTWKFFIALPIFERAVGFRCVRHKSSTNGWRTDC